MTRDLHSTFVASAVAAALLLGAGCAPSARSAGTPSGPPASATAPPPPASFRLGHRDMVRALPRLTTLTGWRHPVECVRQHVPCGRLRTSHGVGQGVYLDASGTDDGLANEMLTMNVIAWPSAAAARARTGYVRRAAQDYQGSFDLPLTRRPSGSYRLGEVGHGRIRSLSAGAWQGFERDSVFRYTVPDRSSKPVQQVYVALRRGRYTVLVAVSRWTDRPTDLQTASSLQAVLQPFLDRLDAAGSGVTTGAAATPAASRRSAARSTRRPA